MEGKQPMEGAVWEEQSPSVSSDRTAAHARVEVFSARIRSRDPPTYLNTFGAVLLRSCNCNYVIFDSDVLEPPMINSEGHLTLTGPDFSVPVEEEIILYPWFIDTYLAYMEGKETILWRAITDYYDRYICRTFNLHCDVELEMRFAVYHDAVEAHLDVCLADMEGQKVDEHIQIHGSITTSNSVIVDSEAKSFLFHKSSEECVSLGPNEPLSLPLSRRVIVVPRKSILLVDVDLVVGLKPGDVSAVQSTVRFSAKSKFEEVCIVIPNCGNVLVKITWVE